MLRIVSFHLMINRQWWFINMVTNFLVGSESLLSSHQFLHLLIVNYIINKVLLFHLIVIEVFNRFLLVIHEPILGWVVRIIESSLLLDSILSDSVVRVVDLKLHLMESVIFFLHFSVWAWVLLVLSRVWSTLLTFWFAWRRWVTIYHVDKFRSWSSSSRSNCNISSTVINVSVAIRVLFRVIINSSFTWILLILVHIISSRYITSSTLTHVTWLPTTWESWPRWWSFCLSIIQNLLNSCSSCNGFINKLLSSWYFLSSARPLLLILLNFIIGSSNPFFKLSSVNFISSLCDKVVSSAFIHNLSAPLFFKVNDFFQLLRNSWVFLNEGIIHHNSSWPRQWESHPVENATVWWSSLRLLSIGTLRSWAFALVCYHGVLSLLFISFSYALSFDSCVGLHTDVTQI